MKTSTVLSTLALGLSASAELIEPYKFPTPVKRDLETVTSVVAQISDAITQLDTSVKAFTDDATQIQSDADNLLSTLKSGASEIVGSSALSLNDIGGLQSAVTSLELAGTSLLSDLEDKKDAIQEAGLCSTFSSAVTSIEAEVSGFVDSVIKELPESIQSTAKTLTSSLTDALSKGTDAFSSSQCTDSGIAVTTSASAISSAKENSYPTGTALPTTTSAADSYPTSPLPGSSGAETSYITVTETAAAETITVTAGDCGITSTSVLPTSSSSAITTPYPAGNSTTFVPTGSMTTTSATFIPTAGAMANGVGAFGLMAGLAAAFIA
ncbi:hydrophobic surface binding protein A-domain-containing protein [Xylariaceae sp. FL1019]|nr:hydrophobic surface binding protein A-domain-containing protein [Xylariaceae sp. FL1019]